LVKDATKKTFFMMELKKTCETLEPVRWSRGGLRWKVILVSFLYIYNKYFFFFKIPLTFWLTLVVCEEWRVQSFSLCLLFTLSIFLPLHLPFLPTLFSNTFRLGIFALLLCICSISIALSTVKSLGSEVASTYVLSYVSYIFILLSRWLETHMTSYLSDNYMHTNK
jgi:hypothetical protein